MMVRRCKSTVVVCAAVALVSISQSHAKTLNPPKFDTAASASTTAFMYTFDYAECNAQDPAGASTFKDYNTPSIVGDLTAQHGTLTECATDVAADFGTPGALQLSNGLRIGGQEILSNAVAKNSVVSGNIPEASLLPKLCNGLDSTACTYADFGFVLEMWINIKDYDTAFELGKITYLMEMKDRMDLRVFRVGGLNQLQFSLDMTGTRDTLSDDITAANFNDGLNLISVVVQYNTGAGARQVYLLYINGVEITTGNNGDTTTGTDPTVWSDTVLRLGTADVSASNLQYSFNGVILLAGLQYAPPVVSAFDTTVVSTLVPRGLPNNPPLITPSETFIHMNEDANADEINVGINPNPYSENSTISIYDFDSITHDDFFTGFVEQSHSLSVGAASATGFTLANDADGTTLDFSSTEVNKFTVYDTDGCNSTTKATDLNVVVSDQDCVGSTAPCALAENVGVCLLSMKDQLALTPYADDERFEPKYQASTPLTITVIDVDNSDGKQFDYTVLVSPIDPALVEFRSYVDGKCNETANPTVIADGTPITFSKTTTFTVCYKYVEEGLKDPENVLVPQVLRTSTLTVKVARGSDINPGGLDEVVSNALKINIVNPISTCEVVSGVPSPCEVSSVKESTMRSSDGLLSDSTGNTFKMTVQDSRGLAASGLYNIKLDTVPDAVTQGSLYLASDTELATPLAANALLTVTTVSGTDGVGEELRFVPVTDFFTRVATSGIPEYGTDAAPFVYTKDLASSENGFLGCATTVAPGCAVSFTHSIIKLKTLGGGTDAANIESQSAVGTVAVHVQAVETRINDDELIFPEGNITYYRDDPAIKFTGDLAIQFNASGTLDTTDDDAFPVQILVSSSTGSFTSSIPAASKLGLAFESGLATNTDGSGGADSSCIRTSCSSTFLIRGAPSLINDALAILTYIPTSATGTKTIKIQVADSNKIKAFEKTFDIIVTSETSPTVSGLGTTIIIVLGSVGGIVLCVCLGVTCLILSKVTCFVRVGYGFCGLFSHSAREHKLHMDREAARKRRGSYDSDSDVEEGRKHRKGGEGGRHGGGGGRHHGRRDSVDSRDDRRDRRHRSRDRREKKERDRHFDRSSKTYRAHAPSDMYASGDKEAKTLVVVPADSLFDWEKHIDKDTGDVYFFNPKSGVSQWHPPTVKSAQS